MSSPMSWMTATTTDSSDSSTERHRRFLTAPPMAITTIREKRVTFDEALLTEQYKSSKMRRQVRYEHRQSLFGILSVIMPLILPYVVAILILVVSSMVPLPSAQRQQQSSIPLQIELVNESTLPTTHPVIYDVASRMWDERTKLSEATEYRSTNNNDESIHSDSADIARIGGSSLLEGSSKKPDTSKELEIVGMETSKDNIDIVQRPQYNNTMTKTVVAFLTERIGKPDTSKELEIVVMETSKSAITVAQRFEHRNPVANTVATFLKVLKAIFSPFHR